MINNHALCLSHVYDAGPDHMNVVVWPKPEVRLVAWSLSPGLPAQTAVWDGRPVYVAAYVRGLFPDQLSVYFDLQVLHIQSYDKQSC